MILCLHVQCPYTVLLICMRIMHTSQYSSHLHSIYTFSGCIITTGYHETSNNVLEATGRFLSSYIFSGCKESLQLTNNSSLGCYRTILKNSYNIDIHCGWCVGAFQLSHNIQEGVSTGACCGKEDFTDDSTVSRLQILQKIYYLRRLLLGEVE